MKKAFSKIHLWLSIPFGLIITIICFTGAMLVFETEIMEVVRKDIYKVERILPTKIPTDILLEGVAKTLDEDVQITGLTISADPKRAYQVNLSKPRRASVYVNQYTGELQGKNERAAFFTFMFRAHRWLLDSPRPRTEGGTAWGKLIVGISTIMFLFVIISGMVIWWPRTIKALKNRVTVSTNKGLKRFWYDLHVSAGFWATLLLLAMAFTGLTWSFPWYRTAFYKVFRVAVEQPQQPPQAQSGSASEEVAPTEGRTMAARAGGERTPTKETKVQSTDSEAAEPRAERGQREGAADRAQRVEEEGSTPKEAGVGVERGRERGAAAAEGITTNAKETANKYAVWETVATELAAQHPTFDKITVDDRRANIAYKKWGNQRASDSYKYEKTTGAITEESLYRDSKRTTKMPGWIYTIHVGSWGGWFSKLLTFFAALIGASLPITGYYLWIKRLQRKARA